MVARAISVPVMDVPGSVSRSLLSRLGPKFDSRAVQFFADYSKSHDNLYAEAIFAYICLTSCSLSYSCYSIVDVDGNKFLGVYAQIASNAVGYNNPIVLEASRSNEMITALANRRCLGVYPGKSLADNIDRLMRIAPAGHSMPSKLHSFYHQLKKRGESSTPWTTEELESCLQNAEPGSPSLSILSFKNSFHGRGFGSLSTTRSKAIHELDVPAFDWPVAEFSELKYPLAEKKEGNDKEVKRCLAEVDRIMTSRRSPVSAIIVEPIQSEGGDNHAPPSFFQGLQDITKKHDALLIADEVQTGFGATGKFWAHEDWNLREPVDIVTFGKKVQIAGYFFVSTLINPNKAYRQFNTWMGDEAQLIICNAIIDEILQKQLLTKISKVGNALYASLKTLSEKHPQRIRNLRGEGCGTYILFDTDGAMALCGKMKLLGVIHPP
ncbi:unnamed protein product [Penicillium salamii]|uniref:4-aminobutyrate aminotransferase n=1 Tax=Penicillium salamii TaxID=1612424 RepID=A0A9W4J0H0_9EURO|nr:unnamed protein product [Penicillium salamii]